MNSRPLSLTGRRGSRTSREPVKGESPRGGRGADRAPPPPVPLPLALKQGRKKPGGHIRRRSESVAGFNDLPIPPRGLEGLGIISLNKRTITAL